MTANTLKKAMEHYMQLARATDEDRARERYQGESNQVDGYLSISTFRQHEMRIDEPKEFGGSDSSVNPAEALLAALAASMEVTCRAWAEYLSIPCTRISTRVSGELDVRGFMDTDSAVRAGFNKLKAELRIQGPVTQAGIDELRRLVMRCCPVLNTIDQGSSIELTLTRTP